MCLSATVGFFGLAALACVFLQENPAALSLWLSAAGGKLSAAASLPSLNAAWNPVFFFLCCLCVLYIFGFFDQKGNAGSVWLPSFLLSLLFVPGAGQKSWPALLFWLIFAGMGIHGAFLCSGKKKGPVRTGRTAGRRRAFMRPEGRKLPEGRRLPGDRRLREDRFRICIREASLRSRFPERRFPGPLFRTLCPAPESMCPDRWTMPMSPGEDEMFFDIDQLKEGERLRPFLTPLCINPPSPEET